MSIKVKEFGSLKETIAFLEELYSYEDSRFIFRGHQKETYTLQSTYNRRYPHRPEGWENININNTITDFQDRLTRFGLMPFDRKEEMLDWLEFARHHGVPTPSIDFTYSPYIAIFFACYNSDSYDNSGNVVVYAINKLNLAWFWAKQLENDTPPEAQEYIAFLTGPKDDYKTGLPFGILQLVPSPGEKVMRMQRQQGLLLYDTLAYKPLGKFNDLEELIDYINERDLPNWEEAENNNQTLYKVLLKKEWLPEVFTKLESMNINGGNLLASIEGIVSDVLNADYYNARATTLRISKHIRSIQIPETILTTTTFRGRVAEAVQKDHEPIATNTNIEVHSIPPIFRFVYCSTRDHGFLIQFENIGALATSVKMVNVKINGEDYPTGESFFFIKEGEFIDVHVSPYNFDNSSKAKFDLPFEFDLYSYNSMNEQFVQHVDAFGLRVNISSSEYSPPL